MACLIVNGVRHIVEPVSGQSLLSTLRDELGLTGAKYGCGEGRCGACTVLVDGTATRTCTVETATLDEAEVRTVEGLSADGRLHPVQEALVAEHAFQCGYCTPGMVMSAVALMESDGPPLDEAAVAEGLAGNVCRCGGYPRILRAVLAAANGDAAPSAMPKPSGGDTFAPADAFPPSDAVDPAEWTATLPPGEPAERSWGWSNPGGARLSLDAAGRVRGFVGKVDGGQGNRVALTRLVAAELGTTPACVRLEMGDTTSAPHDLGTVGSRSTPDAGHALRLVADAMRRALVSAAAARWAIPEERLECRDGAVREVPDGRAAPFGELVAGSPGDHITAGWDDQLAPASYTPLDQAAQPDLLVPVVTGRKRFPSDVTLPGMLHARLLRPPARGAQLRSLDTALAARTPEVEIVESDGLVAALSPIRRRASQALRAMRADWTAGQGPAEADLQAHLRAHPEHRTGWGGVVEESSGDVQAARDTADLVLEATYTTSFLAHVPLEPRVAVASVGSDSAEIWVGTQRPFAVREAVAEALGMDEQNVRVLVPDFGGGFGGKHTADVAVEAALLARAAGRPVKVAWTREEEFRHAYFRPAAVIDIASCATYDGGLTGWEMVNLNSGAAALRSPYDVQNQRVRYQPTASPLAQGSYRALAATANNFARESHLDAVACALGIDPVQLRLRHLRDDRLATVLQKVADRVGWPGPSGDPGRGVGLACGVEKDARVATAAEVSVDPDGQVRVQRIVTAVDCGAVVDPDGLRRQLVGATIMGLGGALFEAVHFDAGRILNASLGDYRLPRFPDVPIIDVDLVDRPDIPSAGAGETPIIAVAPAIANALHAATGRRLRALPLVPGGALPPL